MVTGKTRGLSAITDSIRIILFLMAVLLPASAYSKPSPDERLVLMWQVQKEVTDADLALMKSKGVNLVQAFPLMTWTDAEIKTYLDRMQKNNLGVIMTMVQLLKKTDTGWSPEFDFEKAKAFITKWKDHPAVFAWYAFDEPSHPKKRMPAAFQEKVYNFIKGLDPKGLVFMSWNGVQSRSYSCCFSENSFDVLDIHAYVTDTPGLRQRVGQDNFMKYRKKSYPVIVTLRVYNGPKKSDLGPDGISKQYDFYFKQHNTTRNIGFYGWDLFPNKGIKQVRDFERQFKELKID